MRNQLAEHPFEQRLQFAFIRLLQWRVSSLRIVDFGMVSALRWNVLYSEPMATSVLKATDISGSRRDVADVTVLRFGLLLFALALTT